MTEESTQAPMRDTFARRMAWTAFIAGLACLSGVDAFLHEGAKGAAAGLAALWIWLGS